MCPVEQGPVCSAVEEPVCSAEQGPVCSTVEGPVCSVEQGPVCSAEQGSVCEGDWVGGLGGGECVEGHHTTHCTRQAGRNDAGQAGRQA